MVAVEENVELAAKSSQVYSNAIDIIAEVVDVAIDFVPGGNAAKRVAKLAPHAVRAAKKVAPILDEHSDQINDAIGAAKQAVPDVAKKGGDAIAEAFGKAFDAVSSPIKEAVDASKDKKAQKEAHKKIVDHAFGTLSVKNFMKNYEEHAKLSGESGNEYMDQPGCYIFLVLGKKPGTQLYDYRAVYVGASTGLGKSVRDEIEGRGNVDVYADVKYDQNVHVLFYPCAEDELERMKDSLIIALDADESYNKN